MKLVVSVVHNRDKNRLCDELVKAGFKFTIIGSTGGFLREGNTTLLSGIEDTEITTFQEIIRSNCCTREQVVNSAPYDGGQAVGFIPSAVRVQVGGAVMFVLDVGEYAHF